MASDASSSEESSKLYVLVDSDDRFLTAKIGYYYPFGVTLSGRNQANSKWRWDKGEKEIRLANDDELLLTATDNNKVVAASASDSIPEERQKWEMITRQDKRTCFIIQKVGTKTYYLTSPLELGGEAYVVKDPICFGEEHIWKANDVWINWLNTSSPAAQKYMKGKTTSTTTPGAEGGETA